MNHASALRTLVAGLALSIAAATATASDVHRVALGISPTPISLPLPAGSLELRLDDTSSVEVLGLTRAEADMVVASRTATAFSATVLPVVVGDIFGMPPVSSNWESVRAAVAAGGFATRPTVGVDD